MQPLGQRAHRRAGGPATFGISAFRHEQRRKYATWLHDKGHNDFETAKNPVNR